MEGEIEGTDKKRHYEQDLRGSRGQGIGSGMDVQGLFGKQRGGSKGGRAVQTERNVPLVYQLGLLLATRGRNLTTVVLEVGICVIGSSEQR